MAKKKNSLFNRIYFGSEKSEDYARATLPSNRWELFKDVFRGNFWKLVGINVLTFLFFVPLFLLLFLRISSFMGYGANAPFSAPLGVGYQAILSYNGYQENITFTVNSTLLLLLPVVLIMAGVGLSGASYVIRNLTWAEGVFVGQDYLRGMRQSVLQFIEIALVYSIVFYVSILGISISNQLVATGIGPAWLLITAKIFIIIFLVLASIMLLFMITLSATYKLTFFQLVKNAFLFTVGMFVPNLVIIIAAAIPFAVAYLLYALGGIFMIFGIIIIAILAISFALLVFTVYSQWAFDRYINSKIPGAKRNRGIYEKVKKEDKEAEKYKERIVYTERSLVADKPVKPITDDELKLAELPEMFSRGDIEKLNESRRVLYEDNERYIKEHENDPAFKKAPPTEDEIKAQEEAEKRKEKARAALKKNKKHNR